jgi:hypothetical protein
MYEAKATVSMKSWDEKPYWEGEEGRKLTKVDAVFAYDGDMKGEGAVAWLLGYNPDGTGSALALERFVGTVGSRSGSFLIQHISAFDPSSVRDSLTIVPGSGSGELAGLGGQTAIAMIGPGPYEFSLRYELADNGQL